MLPNRFVGAAGKARFVENEFETWSTDGYDAQTTAMATNSFDRCSRRETETFMTGSGHTSSPS